jgi:hypothetical protein
MSTHTKPARTGTRHPGQRPAPGAGTLQTGMATHWQEVGHV